MGTGTHPLPSLQARALRPVLRYFLRPILARPWPPDRRRSRLLLLARLLLRPPPHAMFLTDRVARPGLWVACQPDADADTKSAGVVLWFHGGAYILGSPRTHRAMLAGLMKAAGVRAFLPRYRLAPEHPAPAAFEDAVAVWDALLARGHAPGRIVLGGDSAGGGLALALLAHACQAGTPPAGLVAFSPWTDLTLSGASIRSNARSDQLLPANRLEDVQAMILGSQGFAAADPRLSPCFAAFAAPPPVLITAAATELLRDDALAMAGPLPQARIAVAGDLPHAWPLLHNYLPEARATLADAGAFIRRCLAAGQGDS